MTIVNQLNQMTSDRRNRWRGATGKAAGVLAVTALFMFALGFVLFWGRSLAIGLIVVAPLWAVVATLILAGADGREEAQRIVERPFDEREHAVRAKALGVGLAAVALTNVGWIIYGTVADQNVVAPVLTILIGSSAVVIAIDVFRRSGARSDVRPAASAQDHEEEAEEVLGRPTWFATIVAWLIATLASSVVGAFFLFGMEQLGVKRLGFNDQVFGAQGLAPDVLSVAWSGIVVYVDTLVFTLTASRWLNRSVSFGWILLLNVVLFGVLRLVQGPADDGSIVLFAAVLLVPLPVLHFVSGQRGGGRGVARRLRLRPRVLGATAAVAVPVVVAAAAFGVTHPLVFELGPASSENSRSGELQLSNRYGPYSVDLKSNATLALDFGLKNNGVADLKNVRIVGVDTDAARVTSVRRASSFFEYGSPTPQGRVAAVMGAHDEVQLRVRLAFACGTSKRPIRINGLHVEYRAFGRTWTATTLVPTVAATCPARPAARLRR